MLWRNPLSRRRARVLGVAVAALVGGVAVGCGSSDDEAQTAGTTAQAGGQPAQEELHIAGVVAQSSNPYFISMKCGAEEAARELGGVKVSWQGPTSASVPQQVTTLGDVTAANPDGVLLAPYSEKAFLRPVADLMRKGVPVHLVDAWLAQDTAFHATYTDVSQSGPVLAEEIAKLMDGEGKLAIVTSAPGDVFEESRYKAMVETLEANHPDITVLEPQYSQGDANKSARVLSGLLAAHPDLKAVYATNGQAGQGSAAAIRTANKTGEVKLVAFDAEPLQVRGLEDGTIQALYAQSPYTMGYAALKRVVEYLRGEGADRNPVKPTDPYYTPSPLKWITKADLSDPETKKFLYRSDC